MADCFRDSPVYDNNDHTYPSDVIYSFPVYPWHRSGSLNNDSAGATARVRSAVLSKKCIGNLKYFKYNVCSLDSNGVISPKAFDNIGDPVYVNENEVTLHRISVPHLMRECSYEGNIDTAITHNAASYPIVPLESTDKGYIKEANDPVRMKYKSSPHLVFSLGHKYYGTSWPSIIPIAADADGTEADLDGNTYYLPDWDESTSTGSTGGQDVVTQVNDHISYLIYRVTPSPPAPPTPDNGLIYCPSNAGLASASYQRFWRGNGSVYAQEDQTGRVLTLGYTGTTANGTRTGVTKAIMYSRTDTSLNITLPKCDANGNRTGTINVGQYFQKTNFDSSGTTGGQYIDWVWKDSAPQLVFKIHGTGTN